MKKMQIPFLLIFLFFLSCENDKDEPENDKIYFYFSFENDSTPSLQGWNLELDPWWNSMYDTIFSDDTPDSSNISLELSSFHSRGIVGESYAGESTAYYDITGLQNKRDFHLSVYAKLLDGSGNVRIEHRRDGEIISTFGNIFFQLNPWKEYTIDDSVIDLYETDTMRIVLQVKSTTYMSAYGLFDDITFSLQ